MNPALAHGAGTGHRQEGLEAVARYYARKLQRHGATPHGVDWTCQPTQQLRFVQLLRVFDARKDFSLNDFGCGYGALREFLDQRLPGRRVDYRGVDIAPEMVDAAAVRWVGRTDCSFVAGVSSGRIADYAVASGIFNVKLQTAEPQWTATIRETLVRMHEESRLGLAVNFMEATSPGPASIEELYTTTPGRWSQWLRRRLGLHVVVRRHYGMREFTLLAQRRLL